jgi:hypothetical protein
MPIYGREESRIEPESGVVGRARSQEYAGMVAGHLSGGDARVLQRFKRQFEREALLGVHLRRLARRDAKESRVKRIDVGDKTSAARVGLAWRPGVGAVERGKIEAVGRNLLDAVPPRAQKFPEFLRIACSPGEAATDAHNRDGLAQRTPLRRNGRGRGRGGALRPQPSGLDADLAGGPFRRGHGIPQDGQQFLNPTQRRFRRE